MSVQIEESGAATVVTMRWVAKRNAIGPEEASLLTKAVRDAGSRLGSLLILTGDGAFSAGGDLAAIVEATRDLSADDITATVYGPFQGMVRALRDCPVPTVAAIDGPAIGLGMDLEEAARVQGGLLSTDRFRAFAQDVVRNAKTRSSASRVAPPTQANATKGPLGP